MTPQDAGGAEDDEVRLARVATALADGLVDAIPSWVGRCVRVRVEQSGVIPPADLDERVAATARRAEEEVGPRLRALLATDIDAQPTSPLAVVRDAVRYPTSLLAELGVPEVVRDAEAERLFPEDRYDLNPASFADLDPALAELGVEWGAAKAYVHLTRRRREGRR